MRIRNKTNRYLVDLDLPPQGVKEVSEIPPGLKNYVEVLPASARPARPVMKKTIIKRTVVNLVREPEPIDPAPPKKTKGAGKKKKAK